MSTVSRRCVALGIIKAAGLGDAAEELKDFIEKSIDD
jgi:hypothetical protein